jgi:hypothetical protein
MTMSAVTSVKTVGLKKLPSWAVRLPPVTTLAPFLTASAMCASTFSTTFMSISGPITAPGSNPSAPLSRRRYFIRSRTTHCLHSIYDTLTLSTNS